ncbi:MAG: fused MFS/spermidine synthase, partial [Deltaproteobacteria bacterium]|nr:fused MFS/spermidine synthase [Deltaproteobacteria bacterium]
VVVGLLIFAISGFCAMAYEVIWTRLLGLIIGPTTYSFTIILATFIVGLALGSLIFGRLADKIKNPLWLLLFTQINAAFLALGISQLLGNSQFFFAKLIYHFKDQFAQLVVIKVGILFAFMLGPTLCLGATFPLVGKIYTQSLTRVGRSIGFAYAINTLGAVSGAFCAGFLLIPWFGKEHSLSLVTGIQLLSSLAIGGYLLWKKRSELVRYIPLSVMAFLGLILCFNFPCWNRQLLSTGRYHRFDSLSPLIRSHGWLETLWLGPKILKKHKTKSELMYYGDGIGGFTTVLKDIDALGIPQYTLVNSGKPDASSQGDMPTQTLLTHLPLLFHPNPKEVMVLGLASGVTAGEVLHYPIERLDIIEISEEVVTASDFFIPWNNKVLSNPKTELIIQDGRAHLELTNRKYDVIISEPSNPWMAGLANLFTREFFLLANDRLNEDGIFVQFFHGYQMDWPTFALV